MPFYFFKCRKITCLFWWIILNNLEDAQIIIFKNWQFPLWFKTWNFLSNFQLFKTNMMHPQHNSALGWWLCNSLCLSIINKLFFSLQSPNQATQSVYSTSKVSLLKPLKSPLPLCNSSSLELYYKSMMWILGIFLLELKKREPERR